MRTNDCIGLKEAARLVSVHHQTIRAWAHQGLIDTGTNDDILAFMNNGKNGRPHTHYYLKSQIKKAAQNRGILKEPTEDMIDVRTAAKALCVTERTMLRIRHRQNFQTFTGPDRTIYILRKDLENQKPGITYQTRATQAELNAAAETYNLPNLCRPYRPEPAQPAETPNTGENTK